MLRLLCLLGFHRPMRGLDASMTIRFCCRTCRAVVRGGLSTRSK